MSVHTQGPMEARAQGSANHFVLLKDNHWVAAIQFNGEQMEVKQAANARLFASSPDMLAALEAIVKITDGSQPIDYPGALMVARAAIAKATGVSS